MSNTVGNNLLRQSLLSPTVLEHQSRINSSTCIRGNTFFQPQANSLIHKTPISTEFRGNRLTIQKNKLQMGKQRAVSRSTRAVLAAHPSSVVGAKSRNIAHLKGKVPSWVNIPTSVALPFGVFETVLSDNLNQDVAKRLEVLKKKLEEGNFSALGEIRSTVLELSAPPQLVKELKEKMKNSGMPWPGDEGAQRWEQAWTAIKKVWASKWNERAYFSTRKVKLEHDYLCMAVLVQEIINADYAFVIHTTNPSSGDSSEIYAEVVKGLGETLVGAYPGRALSFISKKNDLNSPQVLGYPSKPIGLFIRRSIIFRSDSNGEDLEGYAGAGLYDSVPMDEEEQVVLDYSSDALIIDGNFRRSILSSIARAGSAIEDLYGSAQDIEGVVKDGKIYVVQTRPQM
ncbi:UNVERIFIED_CONTAM: Alpha-glucan water dikinase, chloroplastic [Sesamum radiatum]|uniref:alpha-glucan, water dikinase n=1 Tax=Sesamum radiatum TaxID=300843 RepID=A0AAW2MZP2_SESRA